MNTLALLFLIPLNAEAYTLRYKVAKPDGLAIVARLEAATGLNFQGKCKTPGAAGACLELDVIHGHVSTGPGLVEVVVYDRQRKDVPRARAAAVTADIKKKISKAVLGL